MDFADGSAMGGTPPGQVSTVPNLPSPLPELSAGRHAGPGLAHAGRGFAGARAIGFVRDLHRRFVQQCEKRGGAVGPTRRGKGTKIMAIADRRGFPVAVGIASASPHETRLVEPTVEQRFTTARPGCMIGDRAYDSDPLDARLQQQYSIALIAPHKSNRRPLQTQDGRRLRRYCRRWKIERLFAWLHNFRRLVTRWEYYQANFLGLVQLGCILILMRNYL
jgi:transposase